MFQMHRQCSLSSAPCYSISNVAVSWWYVEYMFMWAPFMDQHRSVMTKHGLTVWLPDKTKACSPAAICPGGLFSLCFWIFLHSAGGGSERQRGRKPRLRLQSRWASRAERCAFTEPAEGAQLPLHFSYPIISISTGTVSPPRTENTT